MHQLFGNFSMAMKPVTMTQPEEFIAAWTAAAQKDGTSLSAWVAACCNANLPATVLKTLPDRETVGRKPASIALTIRFNKLAKDQQAMLLSKAEKMFGEIYKSIDELAAQWEELPRFKKAKFSAAVEMLCPE